MLIYYNNIWYKCTSTLLMIFGIEVLNTIKVLCQVWVFKEHSEYSTLVNDISLILGIEV